MKVKSSMWLICAATLLALALLWTAGGNGAQSTEEERIAGVLSSIAGAGKVEVAVFYAAEKTDAFGNTLAAAVPTGAVVVAQGAHDMGVRLQLIRAVRTLLGLSENAVDVFVMEENGT